MKQKPRIYYTESQKALMWECWKQGDSLQMIAQLFDRNTRRYSGFWLSLVAYGQRRDAVPDWR
ncbi:hypothetical protein JAB5_09700 [Janthinobacterium sp. HH103]|nr:hypothetical protein JAB2_05400 [Janthinobacterium sp. HH100]OEZ85922.1 hypothetical protein JAB5_09700 [Janthinobacterium sp. HH103]OFA05272.1 hypothetical protein JAB9_09480 [Janthinobacterium sp. HH107]QOU73669.1 hypothetical protein JAB4_031280 [Janthinobacterium sp. HH102]